MPNLHLANVPDSLIESLRESATRSGRTVDEQAVEALKIGVQMTHRSQAWIEEQLAAARAIRASMPEVWITEEMIRAARDEGRA